MSFKIQLKIEAGKERPNPASSIPPPPQRQVTGNDDDGETLESGKKEKSN